MYILKIQSCASRWLRMVSMMTLATLPLLAWYAIPLSIGLGFAIVLLLSAYTLFIRKSKINVLPSIFWLLFIYVSINWMYQNEFALWTLIPPGGWLFFIFVLALLWGVLTFDLDLLKKYMRYVVLISIALFWIQFCLKVTTGSQVFCFVPNLTGAFTYEGMSYSELAAHHLVGERPCSIFMEPSYMAHYLVTYLAIVWFGSKAKEEWLNKEILLIVISLIALKSGSGMVAFAVLTMVKIFSLFWSANIGRRLLLMFLLIPMLVFVINMYIGSEAGQMMLSRSDEFSTEGSSGFTRVVSGYLMFDQLDFKEQMIGILDFHKRFGILKPDGNLIFFANGVQTILLSLGYLGALFYLLFYASLFIKTSLASRMCIIVLLIMSLIESNYLNPFMMLLTIIPCADYYYNKKTISKICL